jgi:hypothetical protein
LSNAQQQYVQYTVRTLIVRISYSAGQKDEQEEVRNPSDQKAERTETQYNNGSEKLKDSPLQGTQTTATYTCEQKDRADKVTIIHDQMRCSYNQLKLALTNGLIIGTALTAQDVDVYKAIYGPCLACLAGKVTAPSYRHDSSNRSRTDYTL